MLDPQFPRRDPRRAYHRELRTVARVLRLTGLAFALIGVVGLLLGFSRGGWWLPASWLSLILGTVLILTGVIRKVRLRDEL